MELIKKPYEISLWEDVLYWHRRKLSKKTPSYKSYKSGLYYSQDLTEIEKKIENFILENKIEDSIAFDFKKENYTSSNDSAEILRYYVSNVENLSSLQSKGMTELSVQYNTLRKTTPYVRDYRSYNPNRLYYSLKDKTSGNYLDGPKADSINRTDDWGTEIDTIFTYYKEVKICTIGSNSMNSPIRAMFPKLSLKVNGSNELNFSLYSHYYDYDTGKLINNPFVKLLANERKIKVRHGAVGASDTKWYDFVIKDIQENSETKTFDYVAKDIFVNELSKSGFDLVFDSELENNTGNITTLGANILEGSDWKLKEEDCSILQQFKEEPLYEITLNSELTGYNMKDKNELITLQEGHVIYGFYSTIENKDTFFQFLYQKDGKYEIDDNHVIMNAPTESNYFIDGVSYNEDGFPSFAKSMQISSLYRGKKIIRKAFTKYDSKIDKYVNVYEDGIYGFTETEYSSSAIVTSYVTNGDISSQETGWKVGGYSVSSEVKFPKISAVTVPDIRDVKSDQIETTNFQYCLKIEGTKRVAGDQGRFQLYNSGVIDFRTKIGGFTKNEQYVCRVKCGKAKTSGTHGATSLSNANKNVIFMISEYKLENGLYITPEAQKDTIFYGNFVDQEADEDGYSTIILKCNKSLSSSEMIKSTNSLGIFIRFEEKDQNGNYVENNDDYYLEDLQFFKYEVDSSERIIIPGDVATSVIKTIYYYYDPSQNYTSIDDIVFLYKGEVPSENYTIQFDENFEKVRSISAKETNRFNLLQNLCEIFECWVNFEIEHNQQTGEILLDSNMRQRKWVSFREFIGKQNDCGFKYGINLKAIKRNIESEGIVSKLIVKSNSNEFGKDGFCTIARASYNPCGENFILDFNYYIQQGMISSEQIVNDLYSNFNGNLGYYSKLKKINEKRESYILEQSGLLKDITEYSSSCQTYEISVTESQKALSEKLQYVITLTGSTFESLMEIKDSPEESALKNWWESEEVIKAAAAIARLKSIIKTHEKLLETSKSNLDKSQMKYDQLNRILTSRDEPTQEQIDLGECERLLLEKEKINETFYQKYSRFLQEGSWISEDYIDDNLYYLDAESTLHTSAQPKISYDINVLELSQVKDYENYRFSLGDKTHIEDTEFFGWVMKEGIRTPYKEEVVVTELIIMLDEPDKNEIKIQNYKTQFEDLFQRIAATTQSVEYHTGEYDRTSKIIEPDGTINISILQNSMANNALILENAKDQSVTWDDTGITTVSLSNPSEVVRIVSGGIFLSVDGGLTWQTGITGRGINASCLTSGQINTDEILIANKGFTCFRWDKAGISAYAFSSNENGEPTGFDYTKFVRFDQYGLYGIKGEAKFDASIPENNKVGVEKIKEKSNFGLTWEGFWIRSNRTDEKNGYISITPDEDFQVIVADKERVKIGWLGAKEVQEDGTTKTVHIYGLRIKDQNEKIVLETDSLGKLWLRDKMTVETSLGYSVELGNLDQISNEHGRQVINASTLNNGEKDNKFVVYEDGHIEAQSGYFKGVIEAEGGSKFRGTIYADGGQIGNLTIEEIEDVIIDTKGVEIISALGTNFKVSGETVRPEALVFSAKGLGVKIEKISWFISKDFVEWIDLKEEGQEISLSYETFKEYSQNSTLYLKAQIESNIVKNSETGESLLETENYESWITIMSISDGDSGPILIIASDGGNYFKNSTGTIKLTAKLFKDGKEIDVNGEEYKYDWRVQGGSIPEGQQNLKTITIKAENVNSNATFGCRVSSLRAS